jgi:hypothetical protein
MSQNFTAEYHLTQASAALGNSDQVAAAAHLANAFQYSTDAAQAAQINEMRRSLQPPVVEAVKVIAPAMGSEIARNVRRLAALSYLVTGTLIVIYVVKAASLPDASTCQVINNINQQLGDVATCTSSAPVVLLVVAAAIAVVAFIVRYIVPKQ